jgi:hypothetical protein
MPIPLSCTRTSSGRASRPRWLAGLVTLVALTLAGCGTATITPAGGDVSLPDCPSRAGSLFIAAATDSGSERSSELQTARLTAIRDFALRAGACHATLRVLLVPAQTRVTVLFNGPVHQTAGTANAAARRTIRYLDTTVLPGIRRGFTTTLASPPPDRSTPTDLYQLLADIHSTHPGPLTALLLSDFVTQTPTVNLDRALTAAQARTLAAGTPVPDLTGLTIRIAGVGTTKATTPAPAAWVAAIRTYAHTTCTRTHATDCTTTTQTNP